MSEVSKQNIDNSFNEQDIVNIEDEQYVGLTDDEKIDIAARNVIQRFKAAFIELAK